MKPVSVKMSLMILTLAVISIPATKALPGKKAAKALYELPDAMAPAVKAEFTKQCDKGLALYNLTCANCHNQEVNGKVQIPDWPAEKLIGYELRVMNPQHESGLPDEHVTAEELGYIMTFLSYKKKN
jgi:hypothetical protein